MLLRSMPAFTSASTMGCMVLALSVKAPLSVLTLIVRRADVAGTPSDAFPVTVIPGSGTGWPIIRMGEACIAGSGWARASPGSTTQAIAARANPITDVRMVHPFFNDEASELILLSGKVWDA